MTNRFLLTPIFFDEAQPDIASRAEPGWSVNQPSLPEGTKQERMTVVHSPVADFVAKTIARPLPAPSSAVCPSPCWPDVASRR